jgi:hypothetical protein
MGCTCPHSMSDPPPFFKEQSKELACPRIEKQNENYIKKEKENQKEC